MQTCKHFCALAGPAVIGNAGRFPHACSTYAKSGTQVPADTANAARTSFLALTSGLSSWTGFASLPEDILIRKAFKSAISVPLISLEPPRFCRSPAPASNLQRCRRLRKEAQQALQIPYGIKVFCKQEGSHDSHAAIFEDKTDRT